MASLLWISYLNGTGMKYRLVFSSGTFLVVTPEHGDILIAKARGENDFKVIISDGNHAHIDMTYVMYIIEV